MRCVTILSVMAFHFSSFALATDQTEQEYDCLATFSIYRDLAFDNKMMKLFRSLTKAQNDIFLAKPSGFYDINKMNDRKKLILNNKLQGGLAKGKWDNDWLKRNCDWGPEDVVD